MSFLRLLVIGLILPPEGAHFCGKVQTALQWDSALREFAREITDVTGNDTFKDQGHTTKSVDEVNKGSNPEVSAKQNKSIQHEKTSKRNCLKKIMPAVPGPYACTKCKKSFRRKKKLVKHFKKFHMLIRILKK